eukprot:3381124-Prymnesium_polylepis.1
MLVVPLFFFGEALAKPMAAEEEANSTKQLWQEPKFVVINLRACMARTSSGSRNTFVPARSALAAPRVDWSRVRL